MKNKFNLLIIFHVIFENFCQPCLFIQTFIRNLRVASRSLQLVDHERRLPYWHIATKVHTMNKTDDLKLAAALLNFLINIESRKLESRSRKQTLKSVIEKERSFQINLNITNYPSIEEDIIFHNKTFQEKKRCNSMLYKISERSLDVIIKITSCH